jgi:hypothetical protein
MSWIEQFIAVCTRTNKTTNEVRQKTTGKDKEFYSWSFI